MNTTHPVPQAQLNELDSISAAHERAESAEETLRWIKALLEPIRLCSARFQPEWKTNISKARVRLDRVLGGGQPPTHNAFVAEGCEKFDYVREDLIREAAVARAVADSWKEGIERVSDELRVSTDLQEQWMLAAEKYQDERDGYREALENILLARQDVRENPLATGLLMAEIARDALVRLGGGGGVLVGDDNGESKSAANGPSDEMRDRPVSGGPQHQKGNK